MNMSYPTYAGIGARATPAHVLRQMKTIASNLELSGFILRSGGANGADSAFELGVQLARHAEIFLPWNNFNNNPSHLYPPTLDAFVMAEAYHPAWQKCSHAARKFHARNCHQILGQDLDHPVRFVVCWTPNGEVVGGTGQALRIAIAKDIPVFNLADDDHEPPFEKLVLDILREPANFKFEASALPAEGPPGVK